MIARKGAGFRSLAFALRLEPRCLRERLRLRVLSRFRLAFQNGKPVRIPSPIGVTRAAATCDFRARNGYELEPEEIRLAVDWLRINPPAHPLPLETAKKLAKHGGDRRSEKAKDQPGPSSLKYNTKAHWLARMERDGRADLLDLIDRKEISAKEGARRAGYVGAPALAKRRRIVRTSPPRRPPAPHASISDN